MTNLYEDDYRVLGPEHDLSTDALLGAALREIEGDGEFCPSLVALQERPTRKVFVKAAALLQADSAKKRELGARILRELGPRPAPGSWPRTFQAEAVLRLAELLQREKDDRVLGWAVSALGYNQATNVLPRILTLRDHPSQFVRFHVAAAIPGLVDAEGPDEIAVEALRELTADPDADVRFYALTALIDDLAVARERITCTVAARLTDEDDQVSSAARDFLEKA